MPIFAAMIKISCPHAIIITVTAFSYGISHRYFFNILVYPIDINEIVMYSLQSEYCTICAWHFLNFLTLHVLSWFTLDETNCIRARFFVFQTMIFADIIFTVLEYFDL